MAPPTAKAAMEKADAVFLGKCVEVVVQDQTRTCTFEVSRMWKGEIGTKVVVTTAKEGATCGYNFSTDGVATYLVFATQQDGGLSTNTCTRNRELAEAKEDLKELGEGQKPKAAK